MLKELEDKIAALKHKGDTHVKKIMSDQEKMTREEKDAYNAETKCWEIEKGIRLELEGAKQEREALKHYQNEEKNDIVRQFAKDDTGKPPVGRNEFKHMGYLLQAMAIASGNPMVASGFNQGQREEAMHKLALYQAAASGMSVGVPSDGGYLVRKQWSDEFLQKGLERSMLLPRCTRVEIGADFDGLEYPYIDETSRATGSRWGGVQVFWVSEAETVLAKKPKIGKGTLELTELMGICYVTNRLLKDATATRSLLVNSFESEIGFKIDDAIVRGTGSGQMLGFLNSAALVTATRAVDDVDTILEMYSRLPARLELGAIWLHHKNWIKKLPKMTIGDTPVWLPPGGLASRPNASILGAPSMSLEQCSAVGTAGDINLVNLGEYVYIVKAGDNIAFDESMHVRFEYNEMCFRWVYRINGQPVSRSAITPYMGTDTLSAFITVAA